MLFLGSAVRLPPHYLHNLNLDWFSNVYTGIGVYNKEYINRTRMTRMRRIIADKTRKGSASIRSIRVIRVLFTRTSM